MKDYHLCHFEVGDQRYGIPDPMWPGCGTTAAKAVKLATLIDRGVRELAYTYDMGDDWLHPSQSRPSAPANPTSDIRASSMALGVTRPRM